MIRFIRLQAEDFSGVGCEVPEGHTPFAFWDTIADRFVTFNIGQVFDNIEDFEEAMIFEGDKAFAERCRRLIPKGCK